MSLVVADLGLDLALPTGIVRDGVHQVILRPRNAGRLAGVAGVMQADQVERVVAKLRDLGHMAHVHQAGVYRVGVRIVLPGGREAIWDVDGAAGLEAEVLLDGVLVGFVPVIKGSENYTDDQVVAAIADETYNH